MAKSSNGRHIIVQALAGTGKTFTIVEGMKRVVAGPTRGVVGSPEQEAIWAEMQNGKTPRSVCFVAFNKSIATNLEGKVPEDCDVGTVHALLGNRTIKNHYGRRLYLKPNGYRFNNILQKIVGMDRDELRESNLPVDTIEDLVKFIKVNLQHEVMYDDATLDAIVDNYDLSVNGNREQVYDLARQCVEAALDVEADREIDFNDMIWLPIAQKMKPVTRYDMLLGDESQDWSPCQQALVMLYGERIVMVGDEHQAIYGFAGADTRSIRNMETRLQADPRGCVVLPLDETRRCGRAIVRAANKYVPALRAHASCSDGEELFSVESRVRDEVRPGDFILCRVNAPLISHCLRLIVDGKRARIAGRDIGQNLAKIVKKLAGSKSIGRGLFKHKIGKVLDLIPLIGTWEMEEVAKLQKRKNCSPIKVQNVQDKALCIQFLCSGVNTTDELLARIESVFVDNSDVGKHDEVILSSIHKAKGLEADRVFIIKPEKMPHPMAEKPWEREQEFNLIYVAITRAKHTLVWCADDMKGNEDGEEF